MTDQHTLKDGRVLRVSDVSPDDATDIVDYVDRVGAETDFLSFGPGEFELTVAREEAFIERFLRGRVNVMMKGVVDGQLIALLSVKRELQPRLRHVGELGVSVLRNHWGAGVGTHLIASALRVCRARGLRKISLKVRDDNARAIAVYERLGFRDEGRLERALLIRGVFFAERLMGLPLDPG
jgi:RimJ/RimL family protein N-acetyltransferase